MGYGNKIKEQNLIGVFSERVPAPTRIFYLIDNFHLEGDMRISVRDKIFREVVSNILIHREYSNPFPAKLIIENS